MFLRLNVQATISVKSSVAMTEGDVKSLRDVKILQNELTNL